MNDQPTETPPAEASDTAPKNDAKSKKAKKPPVAPTLTAYFKAKAVAPAPFFNAVRASKIERFAGDDLAEAAATAAETDASGVRLLALAAQPGKPTPVDRWVWTAVQTFLRAKIPGAFEAVDPDADAIFRRIHRALQVRFGDRDPEHQKQAEILLALSLTWLANQRSLDLIAVLELLRDTFTISDSGKKEIARKAIADGKVATLQRLAAVSTLLDHAARETRATLAAERQRRAASEAELSDAKTKIAGLEAQIDALIAERDKSAVDAAQAAQRLNEGQQNAGHDIVELRARQRAFLTRRISPLLSDAVDALEITPPEPEIAIRRLKSAIDAIGENTG